MLSHLRVTGALSQEMIKHYAKGDVTDDLYQLACEKAYTVKQALIKTVLTSGTGV